MRLSKFTPSLCTVEGGVFGGMYFYRSMYRSLPRPMRRSAQAFTHGELGLAAGGAVLRRVRVEAGLRGCTCLVALRARCALLARLPGCSVLLPCACCAASSALAGLLSLLQLEPCLVRVLPAEGTALPLGLGDLNNLFLLVGLGLFILSRNTVSNPFACWNEAWSYCSCHHTAVVIREVSKEMTEEMMIEALHKVLKSHHWWLPS